MVFSSLSSYAEVQAPPAPEPVVFIEVKEDCDPQCLINKAFGAEAKVMSKIAWCESRMDIDAVSHTDDHGLFQVNRRTWVNLGCQGDWYNPEDNVKCAKKVKQAQGLNAWAASYGCWQNLGPR